MSAFDPLRTFGEADPAAFGLRPNRHLVLACGELTKTDGAERLVRLRPVVHNPRGVEGVMHIEGSVRANLLAAIASARRWKGRGVHQDTIQYWNDLLDHARHRAATTAQLNNLIRELEAQVTAAQITELKKRSAFR